MPKKYVGFKAIVMTILEESNTPLTSKEIVSRAKEKGLLKSKGKTPDATIRGILSLDIRKRGKKSYFRRVEQGKYSLNK